MSKPGMAGLVMSSGCAADIWLKLVAGDQSTVGTINGAGIVLFAPR
jgi:hypothetical protein